MRRFLHPTSRQDNARAWTAPESGLKKRTGDPWERALDETMTEVELAEERLKKWVFVADLKKLRRSLFRSGWECFRSDDLIPDPYLRLHNPGCSSNSTV